MKHLTRHGPQLAALLAVALLCAGYLGGRAASIAVRSRSTPHDDMRPGSV